MRLFVAIELSGAVKASLIRAQSVLRKRCDGVRWVGESAMHLTLKFIGDVDDNDVVETTEAVSLGVDGVASFDMEVGGCGCFPDRGPVRIIWAGVSEPSGALAACAGEIERRLEELGFPRERKPFSPHITLGRVHDDRSGGRIRSIVQAHAIEPLNEPVYGVSVMASELSPRGATYARVSRAIFSAVAE